NEPLPLRDEGAPRGHGHGTDLAAQERERLAADALGEARARPARGPVARPEAPAHAERVEPQRLERLLGAGGGHTVALHEVVDGRRAARRKETNDDLLKTLLRRAAEGGVEHLSVLRGDPALFTFQEKRRHTSARCQLVEPPASVFEASFSDFLFRQVPELLEQQQQLIGRAGLPARDEARSLDARRVRGL